MFLRKAALRPVPAHAVVDEHALASLEYELGDKEEGLQTALDTGYRELDRRQPALGGYLSSELSHLKSEVVQALGYFLAVTVYLAFREAFPRRLQEVDEIALRLALDTLETDREIRAADPDEVLDSDDVVAMGQPVVIGYVHHHMQEALEQFEDEVDLEELDRLYRAVLIEVIALSHAVASPTGEVGPGRQALA